MGKIKAKSSPELNVLLEEMKNTGYVSSLVISNERLVRVMSDVSRLALSIHLNRSPVEIVKSEQIVFGNLDHRPKKKAFNY